MLCLAAKQRVTDGASGPPRSAGFGEAKSSTAEQAALRAFRATCGAFVTFGSLHVLAPSDWIQGYVPECVGLQLA